MNTGKKIKLIRTFRGLTQKELGEACGIHEVAIRKYELGKNLPKPEQLRKIADALGVNVNSLMEFDIEADGDVLPLLFVALRLGCAGTALLRRTAGILSGLNRLGVIFAFWLKLFHRKPPNHRISGLIPACCSYRTPCQTVAIYVFFRAITLLCL